MIKSHKFSSGVLLVLFFRCKLKRIKRNDTDARAWFVFFFLKKSVANTSRALRERRVKRGCDDDDEDEDEKERSSSALWKRRETFKATRNKKNVTLLFQHLLHRLFFFFFLFPPHVYVDTKHTHTDKNILQQPTYYKYA